MSVRAALLTFQEGVTQLQVYLNRNRLEQEFIALVNEDSRRNALMPRELDLLKGIVDAATNTKQYIYIVSIVSIYGLLERLVDGAISAFTTGL